jgi:hypothetical protein|tara:strand:+ start:791 stop:937 length:147 start_codon:yes stop_codon:yes gene_type:complete
MQKSSACFRDPNQRQEASQAPWWEVQKSHQDIFTQAGMILSKFFVDFS